MIKTENLQKIFRTEEVETYALQNVSLDIEAGEFVAIMGPSGCGKSTLLNIIGMLDNPTGGSYILNGIDVSSYPERQRTRLRKGVIGFVFQSFNLIEELNVFENIELPLLYMGVSATERKQKVNAAMERMQISHRAKHFPQQLSGGQQQRVALARAIVLDPEFLLLDEPLSALDAKVRVRLRREIKSLQKRLGITTIMVTHDQDEALSMADRIVVMNNAVIEQVGTPEEIYEMPKTGFVADFIGTVNFINGAYAIRPEHMAIGKDGEISGRISDIEYRGAFYRLFIDSNQGYLTVDVKADVRKHVQVEHGMEIFINIPDEHIIYLEAV